MASLRKPLSLLMPWRPHPMTPSIRGGLTGSATRECIQRPSTGSVRLCDDARDCVKKSVVRPRHDRPKLTGGPMPQKLSIALAAVVAFACVAVVAQERRSVVLEIGLPNGSTPQLRIQDGGTGTVDMPKVGKFGFVPT